MSEFTFLHRMSVAGIRDYIITHRIDQGDTLVLNPHDFEHLIQDMKNSAEGIPDIPVKILNVIVTQDSTDTVPIGKVQIVKNEKF
ncbi:hypothetical protein HUK80_01025 [Flavobacterium sp. MAH-1]|uniref:Uncharacterized protein n=1 Tax=Flavobacterium agri TaxID=2743471 RepID=A0A7Y8XZB0_9FLAO|nr:hypothetical protein [Flavobacterium agri]NUY79461.1 hypothetical protein [Flavobacterium agri]NYA69486.1 hypothetical protein [Flavobacterium agri]